MKDLQDVEQDFVDGLAERALQPTVVQPRAGRRREPDPALEIRIDDNR